MSKCAVIGGGYVGLATAVTLTHLGHEVTVAEIDPERLETLRAGRSPILEAGLEERIAQGLEEGVLSFVSKSTEAAPEADFVFLCVQTPMGSRGRADLSYLEQAAAEIAPVLAQEAIVVTKSTVPVGSSRVVERVIRREDVKVVSSPEFLQEGSAVHDSLHPTRIVLGCDDQTAVAKVAALLEPLNAPIIVTNSPSAETIKYAANSFLATKISFINAVAAVCEGIGANVDDVMLGIGYDPRIGVEFLRPGPGFGGSCLPKDLGAIKASAEDAGYRFELLDAVEKVNDQQLDRIVNKIARHARPLNGSIVAVWGLTFKARTADLRDSPAIEIARRLRERNAKVVAYDPTVTGPAPELEGIEIVTDPYAATIGASALAILTEWDEFRWLDFEKVESGMKHAAIVDARNLLDPAPLRRLGFEYEGLGR
ncbi:MAG: UDP-glucose/GDP-mannose dehydrogenase family protein [Actinobacteria bacterium]|nr:UDP-glucose/GDP-mannose dehydrogenase family protein [Actinomycetota bacterium]